MRSEPAALVLVGPSGAGKTTIARRIVASRPDRFVFSVSATTRRPRAGEEHGREYLFVSRADFRAMVAGGELLEHAEVHGDYYGTPLASLRRAGRRAPVLDIDVQGAAQVLRHGVGACVIFIVPPDAAAWFDRLGGRGTESPGQVVRRLRTSLGELGGASSFERFVVNDALDQAVADVLAHWRGAPPSRIGAPEAEVLCRGLEAGARAEIARLRALGGSAAAGRASGPAHEARGEDS